MHPIRQSTAGQILPLGPFVDATDGTTLETGLTIGDTDIYIWKNGATADQANNGATHDTQGVYLHTLSVGDIDEVGHLKFSAAIAGARPVTVDCWVYEEAVYDQLYASGATGSASYPVSLVPVPTTRTWLLTPSAAGLVGDRQLGLLVGESKTFAIDFRRDLATNGTLSGITSVQIDDGTEGGVTFDTDNDGVAGSQYKVKITGVTAGTYVIEAVVTYDTSDGGGSAYAYVTLIVSE